jgi:hypothetical protein
MAQTRGSPRCQAISVRSSVSPSIASVLARRWRRGTAIDVGMELEQLTETMDDLSPADLRQLVG